MRWRMVIQDKYNFYIFIQEQAIQIHLRGQAQKNNRYFYLMYFNEYM